MVQFVFNTVIYVFLLLGVCILIARLPLLRFFRAFSSLVRQMPLYNSPRRGTASTLPKWLCCSMYCFVSFCVLFVCICVLYYCHRVTTQLQLTNISYHIKTTTQLFPIIDGCGTEYVFTSARLFISLFSGELLSITTYLRSPNIIPVLKPVSLSQSL